MYDFHFNITGRIIIEGIDDILTIYPENFINLIRISDYKNKLMPVIMCRLNIDREFLDLIINNVEAAIFHLRIGKFARYSDEDRIWTDATYIDDDFTIVLNNDLNYTNDLDYASDEPNGFPNRDKYKEVYFGLISKASLDANKMIENVVIHDTTMQDLVLSYLTHTHLLLEPFEYNDKHSQLIIPPTDTLSSLIDYLASVKVFYSTKYLFFIDEPFCTYLIARNGKEVPMKEEEFSQVNIRLRGVKDVEGLTVGMATDIQNKAYSIDVSTLDSKYVIDHDSAKLVNQIETIIDPSSDNDKEKHPSMQQAKNEIENLQNSFIEKLGGYSKELGNFEHKFGQLTSGIKGLLKDTMPSLLRFQEKTVDAAVDQLFSLPGSVPVTVSPHVTIAFKLVEGALKKEVKNVANKFLSKATSSITKAIDKIPGPLGSITKNIVPQSYNMDYSDNHIGCLTYVNLQETINCTLGKTDALPSGMSDAFAPFSSKVMGNVDKVSSFVDNITGVLNKGGKLAEKAIKIIQKAAYFTKFAKQYGDLDKTMQNILDNIAKMQQCVNETNDAFGNIKSSLDTYSDNAKTYQSVANGISSSSKSLSKIPTIDIKSSFISPNIGTKDFTNNLNNIAKKAENILSKASSFMSIGANILSAGTITFNDILNLKENLAGLNIDKVGTLGISSFETDLNILHDLTAKRGSKIVRIRNDNPNELKNVKSELETMVNQLTINKFGLDPSIFTPNKKYVVLNYDMHNEKNGLFLLNNKTELYIREDETFVCNTRLDLAKLPDVADTSKARATSM